MKRDIKALLKEVGSKTKEGEHDINCDLGNLSKKLSRHHINLSVSSLKKLMELVTGKRKLSTAAKNRLALFAGFQSWGDLDDALHGNDDGDKSYTVK
ncbi:hypothetical protein PRBRB14_00530 [Hallella multisaccharivorax DSM 17128]|uniref:Uncharacterized protein n=1 Tax=Hallella multisaccharivorax DSM 17128 TaxID=688246 RepID=F8N8X9_9BACT|nr:hypothetical protein [Hallella multisaccharivorax]EGN55624.1 hypothetical protein Premu_0133 [Hallella multisaccharivorax DSM 17128]GJG29174.1 hypothetical protein PRBRB14_00530 [Hallella multisaccharivorax DSM 17128]